MTATLPMLLREFDLGGLPLPNRVVMAPLTRCRAGAQRLPNALMATYYAQRASAGLIISEATVVAANAVGYMGTPGIYNDAQVQGWKLTTQAVHAAGGRIYLQLWHCGRASHSDMLDGALPVSASAVPIQGDMVHTPKGKKPYETPRPLETSEIPGIVEQFRAGAQRAKDAGFDGVEIHGANGYLIDQFLQSRTNQRTDLYGGTLDNRFRLLRQIVEAVLTVWPAQRVGVRLSPNGVFNDMGSPDYRETFSHAAQQLNAYRLGYLHVMDGSRFGVHQHGPLMTLAEFRQWFKGAIMGNCGYTQEQAESMITAGHADLISFGRPFISNPDLVERFARGWPLNTREDMSTWYSPGEKGYTDFPRYSPAS
jgi:2,4-dienoyl-CoA reductase-like NADH-dependent reductase (Old Yellow Enzyme family)